MQTVNHDHMTLTRMLNVAMSDQFSLVSRNVSASVPKPDPKNERDRIVTSEEWGAIREHAAPHLARLLTVAYDLGPRRGELLRLEWADVDMKRKEFTLRETKNGEARTIPMTPEVYEAFGQLLRERRLDTPRGSFTKEGRFSADSLQRSKRHVEGQGLCMAGRTAALLLTTSDIQQQPR